MFFCISVPNNLIITTGYYHPPYPEYSGHLSQTETLSIKNNGDPPNYPDHPRKIYGATGGFLHKNFITCGGDDSVEGVTNYCYKLGSEGTFATMMSERYAAASVVLEPEKIWVLGGSNSNSSKLSTTEYIFSDGRNEEGPPMPIALATHAMVKINQSTSILVGGNVGWFVKSKRTWFYDGNWIEGPDLQKARFQHSVGTLRDPVTDQVYVVVAGGYDGSYLNDVEILRVAGTAWETGKLL